VKTFLALLAGVLVGAGALYLYNSREGQDKLRDTGHAIENAARSAGTNIQDRLRSLDLNQDRIMEELSRGGQVIRRKAQQAGAAIADATADARVTGAIKAKYISDKNLSGLGISVNTTDGVVTLSGSVGSAEDIGKAMLLALETQGVKEVISTLQVKAQAKKQ
jgi:hypothetical protein